MSSTAPQRYHGVVGTTIAVVREEGFLSLYKGNGANVLRVIPTYAIKFAFTDLFKDMVRTKPGPLSNQEVMLSGSLAGVVQITVSYPLEVLRTRLSLSESLNLSGGVKYRGIIHCATHIARTEGLPAFYKGIGPTYISGVPYVGLQMMFYDLLKSIMPRNEDGSLSLYWKLTCGALAGLVSQTVTYPGDTVRRRMQTNGVGGMERIYQNSWDCLVKILRREGIPGLFRGLSANAIRSVPGAGIQFASYDAFKVLFGLDKTQ
eukprot:TRINITY_DN5389_c1_g1_i2.p1 TRINITY_DN5389_c1_g1~~TRINITY_DN5389_c1_g1_i2.p1  ORF type:complete len:261 (-),score=47.30 TRINITY_DN5389_c1_g1_i2:74-856(-)